MTYLNLVNAILKRLREDSVSTIGATAYSTLIGEIANDAMRQVEDAWNWSALRTDLPISAVASTKTYSLTGTANRATIIDARNLTSNWWMCGQSTKWGRAQDLSSVQEGPPQNYVLNGVDGSGDTQVDLYPTPGDSFTISFNVFQRTADLSDDTDTTNVPDQPIIQLAYAMAAREKGEVGGQTSRDIFAVAERMLADAIAYDSALTPTEVVYYTV